MPFSFPKSDIWEDILFYSIVHRQWAWNANGGHLSSIFVRYILYISILLGQLVKLSSKVASFNWRSQTTEIDDIWRRNNTLLSHRERDFLFWPIYLLPNEIMGKQWESPWVAPVFAIFSWVLTSKSAKFSLQPISTRDTEVEMSLIDHLHTFQNGRRRKE